MLLKVQEQKVELGFEAKSLLVGVGWILVSGMNDNFTVKNLYRDPRQLNQSNNDKFLSRGAVRSNNRR
jgi:hypothetical protein